MDLVEAQEKAQSLYGAYAVVEEQKPGFFVIDIGEPKETWKGWPPRLSLGWGRTLEDAFALAEERVKWHDLDSFRNWIRNLQKEK